MRVSLYKAGHLEELQMLVDGKDLYKLMAADIFRVPEDQVTDEQRGVGKVAVLSCQYGMGAAEYQRKVLVNTGQVISIALATKVVGAFRKRFSGVCEYWRKLDKMGHHCAITGQALRLDIGTDRELLYPGMKYKIFTKVDKKTKKKTTKKSLGYIGENFKYTDTWGGKLYNNFIQAPSKDIILAKMVDLWEQKVNTVATIHDEILAEVPIDDPLEKWEKIWFEAGKKYTDKWMPGLSLGSDASFMRRYSKG